MIWRRWITLEGSISSHNTRKNTGKECLQWLCQLAVGSLKNRAHERESSEQRRENCKRPVYTCGNDLCNSQRQSPISTSVLVRNIESCPEAALNCTLDLPRSSNSHHQSRWLYPHDSGFLLFLFFSGFLHCFHGKENAKMKKWKAEILTQEANYIWSNIWYYLWVDFVFEVLAERGYSNFRTSKQK